MKLQMGDCRLQFTVCNIPWKTDAKGIFNTYGNSPTGNVLLTMKDLKIKGYSKQGFSIDSTYIQELLRG